MGKRTLEWNPEQVQILVDSWAEGLSCSQIAKRIGDPCTRNAVIGKKVRMKLPNPTTQRRTYSTKVAPAAPRPGRKAPTLKPRLIDAEAPLEICGALVTLENLVAGMCRWPIGDPIDPGFRFCGNTPMGRRPYCEAHAAIARQAAPAPPPDGYVRLKQRPGQPCLWK